MNPQEVLEIFRNHGALLEGHFVGVSGIHIAGYLDKYRVFNSSTAMRKLCLGLVESCAEINPTVVVAPAGGGKVVARSFARLFSESTGVKIGVVFAEKPAYDFSEKDLSLLLGSKVVVVDDVVNTGFTLERVCEKTHQAEATIEKVLALASYGKITAETLGVPELFPLTTVSFKSWAASTGEPCRLCEEGVPININIGHGVEFLARQTKED